MPMESADFEEVLQEALTERDMQLQEKELPEINIGEALPVKEGLDFSRDYVDFGVSEVVGSVKDGIIGNKTNSLKTIDSDIEWLKAPVGQWAKAATWTQQELEKIARLNINLQTKKQDDLYANALATIQYAGYVGHRGVKGQEGLLTGTMVQLITDTSGKTIAEMTSDGFVKLCWMLTTRHGANPVTVFSQRISPWTPATLCSPCRNSTRIRLLWVLTCCRLRLWIALWRRCVRLLVMSHSTLLS